MLKLLFAASASLALLGLTACGPKGSAEKAGENLDSAIEETTQGQKKSGDGALEKAGESIDKATGKDNNDVVDSASDATDNDSKTKP